MAPFPIVKRYNYQQFEAITFPTGGRVYHTPEGHEVPSVTTILSIIPKPELVAWRKRKGEVEAQRITDEACRVGTTMHDTLEGYVSSYLQGRPDIPASNDEEKMALQMAGNMRRYGLVDLDEVWGIEAPVYCRNLYAGRTDLIGVFAGKSAVIDYKSSKLLKKPEWIENYKMQIAAYNLCHKAMFGEGMETGVILIAIRPPHKTPLQRFVMSQSDLDMYEDKWLAVVDQYYSARTIPKKLAA